MAGQKSETIYDNPYVGWMMVLSVVAVVIYILWYFYHPEIRNAVRWVRYAEMQIVAPFLPEDYTVKVKITKDELNKRRSLRRSIRESKDDELVKTVNFHEELKKVPKHKKSSLKYQHLATFNSMAMHPLKMPLVYLLGAGALWCMFLGPTTQYRRKLGLEDLIDTQSKIFPVISPFVKFNPSTQPPRPPGAPVPAELPAFAEALGPEEWLAYNSIPVPDGKLDEEATLDAFMSQLGARWRGPNALPSYKQVLLAAFCLKAARKRSEADEMLGALAKCWTFESGLELDRRLVRKAQEILKDKDLAGKTLAVCNQHAFETTAILRALAFAREQGGVLAPAQFVWLRAHDRELWYPLNNLGRQSYHMEALGAMAHFKAERLTRRPIPVPKVDNALITIKTYMGSLRARPIPELDYSKSKKRGVKKAV